MRLIDADKMAVEESEAYISAQCQIKDELMRSVNAVVHTKIQRLIADTPTVDAVEVVRCKDCKCFGLQPECELCEDRGEACGVCGKYGACVPNDGFCYYGRKNEKVFDND